MVQTITSEARKLRAGSVVDKLKFELDVEGGGDILSRWRSYSQWGPSRSSDPEVRVRIPLCAQQGAGQLPLPLNLSGAQREGNDTGGEASRETCLTECEGLPGV